MTHLTDIEIARECRMKPITEIAEKAHVDEKYLESYGRYKAKVDPEFMKATRRKDGKLILVTAITPTPAGEGKTLTAIGLADGLNRIGKDAVLALREPSLGPVFGVKGGATGGGYAQVMPMIDINLHFTGDFHAIAAANNLLAAMLDNHIHQGNKLGIDPRRVVLKRCVDMNDRQLRNIADGLGGRTNGVPREDGFEITAATELMAIFCLTRSLHDLKERIARMIVAYTYDNNPVTAADLRAVGAMTALMRDAIKPNLVQTLEGTPAFVHGGPFANIAHGCNSIIATMCALKTADYAVTECGFGADLGAEKFLDIKCRLTGLAPDAVVMVASVRSLKMHGGVDKKHLTLENTRALKKGIGNLLRHVKNIREVYSLPCVVAINRFPDDTDAEISMLKECCKENGITAVLSTAWADGGAGTVLLAKEVVKLCSSKHEKMTFAYDIKDPIAEKIKAVVRKVYGGDGIQILPEADKQIRRLTELGFENLPVCIAKTQFSFSDAPNRFGAPEHFSVTVRNVKVSAGAGFIVVLTGDIVTMPGLPKTPTAENIDMDDAGNITGLF